MTFLLLLIFMFDSTLPVVSASSNETIYARVMFDDVILYKSPIEDSDYSNIYFELPKTYFVKLIDSANDQFYLVNYLNFSGYVKKDSVQAIAGTPTSPYLDNISFRVYAEMSRDLRLEPTLTSGANSQITYIPLYSRNITYFGTIKGEQLIEGRTDVWYYCRYTADKEYYGYVYSDFCDELSVIQNNNESVSYIPNPEFNKISEPKPSGKIDDNTVPILVMILSVPAVIFTLMILKGKQILSKEPTKKKEIIDY